MTQSLPPNGNPDWLAALGLEQDPFAPGYRPEFFYAEPVFLQRLDLLTHLLQFSDSLLVVLGEQGAGKTSLARELRQRAGENWRVCVLQGTEVQNLDTALRRLAEALGLDSPPADLEALSARVMDHCADLRESMALPVLLIDDAEQVPPSLLRRLAGLAGDPGTTVQRLRILLFGAPALEGLLAQAGLAPGLAPFVQTLSVPRLNEVQAAAYLMYRLTVAGYGGESPFSSIEVRAIAKASGGLPGPMNALAREALRNQAGLAVVKAGGGRGTGLRWLTPLLVGLLFLAAGAWWLVDGTAPLSSPPELVAQRPLTLPPPSATGRIESRLPAPGPEAVEEPGFQEPEAEPEVTEEGALAGSGVEDEAPSAEEAPVEVPVETPDMPPPAVAAGPDPAPAPVAEPEAAPEPAPEPGPGPAVKPEPTAEPTTEPPVAQAPTGRGLDWIRAQPGERYTLQLLVSRSEDAVRAFVSRHGLEGELAWYHRRQKGEDRYTLLFGSYPSASAAQAAVAGLPAPVRRDQPWPRSFASVQAQLPAP